MSQSLKALNDFLAHHCEVKPLPIGPEGRKERCYILNTEDCLLFMAEAHVQEIRDIIDQTAETVSSAKAHDDYSNVVMSYNWDAPEPGMNSIRIPLRLIESLDDKRALMILRNLEGIQKDIYEGKTRKEGLQNLFDDTAHVRTSTNLDGERIFIITGKKSSSDRRHYAELVATNVLFKLPKALNARLQKIVPKETRGNFFLEGRDITSPKIRYGTDIQPELTLTDEGAYLYTELSKKTTRTAEAISKVFRQSMLDPFGFSLKYYMGKHAVIKLASSKKEK